MTVPVTNNVTLTPGSGWQLIVSTGTNNFLQLSKFPCETPVYLIGATSAPPLVGTVATGTVTFATANPTAGQVVTIGTETYTFVTTRSAPFQVALGGTFTITAGNLQSAITTDSALVNATIAGAVVTIKSKIESAAANYSLTTNGTNVTVSGATLTGGTSFASGYRWAESTLFFQGAIGSNVYARIQNNAPNNVIVSVFAN